MKSISAEHEEDRLDVGTISFNYGWYLLLRGAYDEAEVMQRWALEAREKVIDASILTLSPVSITLA